MKSQTFGIVNITEDSFSDGARYLAADAAISHARSLDADVLDLGAAASNPDAREIPPDVEIARLEPVVAALKRDGRRLSIDTFSSSVQRWAIGQQVEYINDIQGFSDSSIYGELAASSTNLVVMHSVQERGRATRVEVSAAEIFERARSFFEQRVAVLTSCGIARSRLILDPGMGFFLGSRPEASFEMLRRIGDLRSAFNLPVLVSVSRKSFLRAVTKRTPAEAAASSLAAELFAVCQGADYIRTHDPAALTDAVKILERLA